jgi:hypothetical protein
MGALKCVSVVSGTSGSNPLPSSGESANFRFLEMTAGDAIAFDYRAADIILSALAGGH